jgi:hypothetical protein
MSLLPNTAAMEKTRLSASIGEMLYARHLLFFDKHVGGV